MTKATRIKKKTEEMQVLGKYGGPDKLEGVNVPKEYKLILKKKCLLPLALRQLIAYRYVKAVSIIDFEIKKEENGKEKDNS